MEKFRNKYRIQSARLVGWDYGNNGSYFITICTHDRECFFGKIENGEMNLGPLGLLAEKYWAEIPGQFPFVEIGNFVVMPNHIHGILIIDNNARNVVETRFIASPPSEGNVPLHKIEIPSLSDSTISTKKMGGFSGERNPMFHENISRIVRWYKGVCSYEKRKIEYGFRWLPRFHDHIIRNALSFVAIQHYIENNPYNWKDDQFYL